MELATMRRPEVTDEELREAEEGLVRLLHKKRFPREWIERNVPDAMAQARTDFAARLAAGKEDDTVNLLVVIGYRRAVKMLDAQLAGPPTTSIETVFHLADESTPTPEEEAIDHDREERVLKAMATLPERERALMALVYFDGKSVRDAGRRLGWGKSSADRHHRSALEKLHELLDHSLLSPEISVPAYIAARHWHHDPLRALTRWLGGAGEALGEALMVGGGRLTQAAETGSAAAASGAGRSTVGVCGAALVMCITGAATGVVGPGLDAIHHDRGAARVTRSRPLSAPRESASPFQVSTEPASAESRTGAGRGSTEEHGDATSGSGGGGETPTSVTSRPQRGARKRGGGSRSGSPEATTRQTVNEFGVQSGEVEETAQPAPETSSSSPPSEATAPPSRAAVESPSSGSAAGSSGTKNAGSEFGM
jgi:RNA polymerase sigma factor (sigma-70 family)